MKMLAVALVTTLVAPVLAAEELGPGTRVRVVAPGIGRVVGSLVAIDAEALTLRTGKDEPRRFLLADVEGLEVSRKRSRRGRGALIGLAAGAVGGYIWGAASNPDGCRPSEYNFCFFGEGPWFSDEQSGMMGAVALGGIGAIVGAIVAPGEKWDRVSHPRVRVSVAPGRGGATVGVSLRF